MEFYPDSFTKFVTCGLQHMTLWQFKADQLTYSSFIISNPIEVEDQGKGQNHNKDDQVQGDKADDKGDDKGEQEDEEKDRSNLTVLFFCVKFMQDLILTAGDDGFVYLWEDKRIVQKEICHQRDMAIQCMDVLYNQNVFATGGTDGHIKVWSILWQAQSSYKIQLVYDALVLSQDIQDSNIRFEFQIQSVCFGNNAQLLFGTKNGNIYQTKYLNTKEQFNMISRLLQEETTTNQKTNQQFYKNCQEQLQLLQCFNDQDVPADVAFSQKRDTLFVITNTGLFRVWNIDTMKILHQNHFKTEANQMICCRKCEKMILAFYDEVKLLDTNKYAILGAGMKFTSKIADIKLQHSEQILAVALGPDNTQKSRIEIYQTQMEQNKFNILVIL